MRLKRLLALALSLSMTVSAASTAALPAYAADPESSASAASETTESESTTSEENAEPESTASSDSAEDESTVPAESTEPESTEQESTEPEAAEPESTELESTEPESVEPESDDAEDAEPQISAQMEEVDGSKENLIQNQDLSDVNLSEKISPDEDVRVIIVMDGDSVVAANSAAVFSNDAAAEMDEIKATQDEVIEEIEEAVLDGEQLDVSYQYSWLVNGVAATVPYGKLEEIQSVDGVDKVVMQTVYEVCEDDTDSDVSYPMTVSDGAMIGRESTWAAGYTGEGMKIAVIDTGLDEDHQNFAALPEDVLTDTSLTEDDIAGVLPELNATQRSNGLTADDLYRTTKIAYGYNYVDSDLDITHDNDTEGDHGTHVAGIAAANKVDGSDVVGVAPDAQLMIMKVFGKGGGAYTEDWLAALEDAMILGADVVNMSLGSNSGFTTDEDFVNEVFNRVADTGTVLCISAGNAYTMGYNNAWGLNANLTENPDNAVVGSPGTYANALSVASVENVAYMSPYISVNGDHKIGYTDGGSGVNKPFQTLAGNVYEAVAVPGTGTADDFAKVNVAGKIAVVERGVIAFTEKCENAQKAGAVGCLVYNNTTGTITMDMTGSSVTIPCASITMTDGAYILSALEENEKATFEVGKDEALIDSETAYQMSDFSSWGVTPSLTLEPDITAPGGNIYSTLDGGKYGLMSGTSMASPNLAGISALVKQYATSEAGLNGADGAATNSLVRTLLMSTSVPLVYQNQEGLYYSPRKQGSGLANAYGAVTTQAYLTVDGCDVPKAELGDDKDKTGAYSYTFNVTNMGDKALYYDLDTVAQTEDVNADYADQGLLFMSGSPKALDAATAENTASMVFKYDVNNSSACDSHDAYWIYRAAVAGQPEDADWADVSFRYNVNGGEAVDTSDVQAYLDALVGLESDADLTAQVMQVAAGSTEAVSVTVTLADSDRTYFANNYPNGCYVEGYTFLNALNAGGVDLSLPYLAFYGDWNSASIFDGDNENPATEGFDWNDPNLSYYNQYPSILWTQAQGQTSQWIPGLNPYINEEFDISHVSLSPNGDGFCDYIDDLYVSLLRNAGTLTFTYRNAENPQEVYFQSGVEHVSKSSYSDGNGLCLPYVYSWYGKAYDLTDASGAALPNNTKVELDIAATLDYPGAEAQHKTVNFTVDTEGPTMVEQPQVTVGDSGETLLTLTFQDNVSVAAVNFLYGWGGIAGQLPADDAEAVRAEDGSMQWTQTYNVSGLGDSFYVVLGDYAANESTYEITLNSQGN